MSNDTTKISELPGVNHDIPKKFSRPKGLKNDLNVPDGNGLQINDNLNPGTQGAISGNPIPGSSQIQKSKKKRKVSTGSSPKGKIKIDPYIGHMSFGSDDEELDEIKSVLKDQISKLEDLKDLLIDYAADNVMKIEEKNKWKSNFHFVDEKLQDMPNISKSKSNFYLNSNLKDSVLGPEVLDKLNEIYKRWM